MSQIGEINYGLDEMQERVERERVARTIMEFLRERMDGVERVVRRNTLKERLRLKGLLACCGSTRGFRPPSSMNVIEEINVGHTPPENFSDTGCAGGHTPAASGMSLAAALSAERHLRAAQDLDMLGVGPAGPNQKGTDGPSNVGTTALGEPFRMTLMMRLLAESDGLREKEEEREMVGCDSVCCVCMGRKKGAALIPCGHTFCRVCSREIWLNRGSCPLCNRLILEILDIF